MVAITTQEKEDCNKRRELVLCFRPLTAVLVPPRLDFRTLENLKLSF